ncbi:DUF1800 family protein [Luteolibacter marinus]|uniref:DUF1800 family protein n=1 Tax=Luteolibacter marinus TaxID=2776705 RepID=UPI001866B038|nr:DUF1800 family protein [Luteolibacter marinus]
MKIPPPLWIACSLILTHAQAIGPISGAGSKVWLARFNANDLVPTQDTDRDGLTNEDEALAGTDPRDPNSRPAATILSLDASQVVIEITAQPGKGYRLQRALSPAGPWQAHGKTYRADEETLRITTARLEDRGFYIFEVSDLDSDRDGISDWDERQLAGFDPDDDDSFSTGHKNGDAEAFDTIFGSLQDGHLTVTATTTTAYESDQSPAILTFTRDTGIGYPFTVFVQPQDADDPTKSSAKASDYHLEDEGGGPVADRMVIPAGQTDVSLKILATKDHQREVPEELHLVVGGSNVGATVFLRDAIPTLANQQLFLADLRPVPGSGSRGSGTAVVWLPADNDIARICLSFTTLDSPVSAIRIEDPGGSGIHALVHGGYDGQDWPLRAGGNCPTDQAVLDALCSSALSLSIQSDQHPLGEVRGTFHPANGTIEFEPPPDPAPVQPLAGEALDRDIVRFLNQATFGATMADIENLRVLVAEHSGDRLAAFGQWIDDQFAMPSPSLLAYLTAADRQEIELSASLPSDHPDFNPAFEPAYHNRIRGWWLLAVHAPDQLRQRAAFALGEIFVVSDHDAVIRWRPHGMANYHDMLAAGASGSYRKLLEMVAIHPVIGQYLSHLRNDKALLDEDGNAIVSPDENFARELLQLFSIGLTELHPDGSLKVGADGLPISTYFQRDISELARVFTGWSFGTINSPPTSSTTATNNNFFQGDGITRLEAQWTHPMAMFPDHHDDGEKHIMSLILPPGLGGEEDLERLLDFLANHPNTAPFICRRLIQRFVTAKPTRGYVFRVSSRFVASGGDLKATIKAILLDPEARMPDIPFAGSASGKKREPLLRFVAFLRAFDGASGFRLSDLAAYGYPEDELMKFPSGVTRVRMGSTDAWLRQTPQSAPSVFNWFGPDYIPPGILAENSIVSPEFQLLDESSGYQELNYHYLATFDLLRTSTIPGQELPPQNYTITSQFMRLDLTPLVLLYMQIVDTNGDGKFDHLDASFNNPPSIEAACRSVIDRIDLLLCAGRLKATAIGNSSQARGTILATVSSIRSQSNGIESAEVQAACMDTRIRNALWLVLSSSEAAIQK